MRAIDPSRSEQLLRTDYTELFAKLIADQVLTAVASIE
jgi:hypothetical protein